MARRDVRIRVDEEKKFPARRSRAGVAGGCDLAAIYADDASPGLPSDRVGRVGRGVIHHDDFVRFFGRAGRAPDCSQCFRQLVFFVMSGDNKRQTGRRSPEKSFREFEKRKL